MITPDITDNGTGEYSPDVCPLAVRDAVNNSRNFAVFFAAVYGVVSLTLTVASNFQQQSTVGVATFYFILAALYVVCASQLSSKRSLGLGWAITTAALGILSAISVVGILIEIALWRNVYKISQYKKHGASVITSDEQWRAKHKRSWSDTRQIITALASGIIISGAIIGLYTLSGRESLQSTTQVTVTPYISTQHGFTINFPTTPTNTNSSIDVQGVSVPTSTYTSEMNNGNTAYLVAVDSYPEQFDVSDSKAVLEAGLNGQLTSEKAKLISSSYGTLEGYTSLNSHSTVDISGQPFDSFATLFLKGNTLYQIVTIGANESDFNAFVGSFQFIR